MLAKFYTECAEGISEKGSTLTVGKLADIFFNEEIKRNCKESTITNKESMIKIWIKPYFENKKAVKLKRKDVQSWINEMYDEGKSIRYIRNVYVILNQIYNYGIRMEYFNNSPCNNIIFPKTSKKEARYYNDDDVKKIIKGLYEEESVNGYECAYMLALFGGLRRGEILALTWEDIDFKACTVSITKNRVTYKKGIHIGTPKTPTSIRTIAIPEEVIDKLKELKKRQLEYLDRIGSKAVYSNAVIMNKFGKYCCSSNVIKNLKSFCEKNDVPFYGLHSFRHTHVSMLVSIGTDVSQVSKRLGHANINTTLSIYTHLFKDTDKDVADALSKSFLE